MCVCVPVGGALAELVHAAPHGSHVLVHLGDPDVSEVTGLLPPQQIVDLTGRKK